MPTSSGEEVSTGELKNVLKEIVDGEDKRKPYTDDELLVELMNEKKKGYQIARRTIAKYRQLLDIIPGETFGTRRVGFASVVGRIAG